VVAIVGRGNWSTWRQGLGRLELRRGGVQRGCRVGRSVGALIGWIFGLFNWIEPVIRPMVLAATA